MGSPGSDGNDRSTRKDRAIHVVGWALLAAVLFLAVFAMVFYQSV